MKIRRDIVDYIYFAFFGIILVLFITGQFSTVTGTTLVVIDNPDPNSMFPTYFQGDLFVIFKSIPENFELGDVIVYENNRGSRIIHRIIDIVIDQDGGYHFRVKGDNAITNFQVDIAGGGTLVPYEQVLGKVVSRIPYLGHISLAMQRNLIVQLIVYLSAIAITLAIIFWPDEEEEEEQEFYTINQTAFKEWTAAVMRSVGGTLRSLRSSPHRSYIWIVLALLVFGMISPIILPGVLPMSSSDELGITKVEINRSIAITEEIPGADVEFYNISVHMFDDTTYLQHIEGYTLEVFDTNGELIDTTIWNTRRVIKGSFMVGGSITIDNLIFASLTNGSELQVEITVHVGGVLQSYDLPAYQTSFVKS